MEATEALQAIQAGENQQAIQEAIQAEAILEPVVEEPTAQYVQRAVEATPPLPAPRRMPIPFPFLFGTRVLIWKQDPSVRRLGRRVAYLRGLILNGPRDFRINTSLPGTTPVVRNARGDFIFRPSTTPESDCAHTFAVVRQALTMWQRRAGGTPIPWAWNAGGDTSVITVHPRAFTGANAFYSRNGKSLRFGHFMPSGGGSEVFTCRSFDIVAHECGHAILDGLKPGWLGLGNPPQTGGLHESFGDLSAVFLALSQFDQVDLLIALTKANPHKPGNFLAEVAEQFGDALGRPSGLRNADNDLRLSQVGNQVHALSQVFTGAIYDITADIFSWEWRRQRSVRGPEQVLFEVAQTVSALLLEAIKASPAVGATYVDVGTEMLTISKAQSQPVAYRSFIRHRFAVREIALPLTPLVETAMTTGILDLEDKRLSSKQSDPVKLEAADAKHPSCSAKVPQDRTDTCGTMQLPENCRHQKALDADLEVLRATGAPIAEEALFAEEVAELEKAFK